MEQVSHPERLKNQFASDNYAGACPEAMQAFAEVNAGFASAYGNDPWTARACDLLREFFETDCQVFFVFNGTAANSLALASLCHSYHSIICHALAHVETDECGAAEFFSNGTKILLVPGEHGKVDPAEVAHTVTRRSDIHYPKPKVLSLTQATELGTVYSLAELGEIRETAQRFGLRLHLDGARFANALATLGCAPKELTWQAGIDVMTVGGTKNGLAVGEAVVFFNRELAREFDYRCKQAGQLASKMRFLSAPWIGLLKNGAFVRNAVHANRMAQLLAGELQRFPQVTIIHPVEANAVFVQLPEPWIEALHRQGWQFYTFIGTGHARLMCSWQTSEQDIRELIGDIRHLAGG